MEDDLEQQVAQLLGQRMPRPPAGDAIHLVEHLVAFLDQVGPQAAQVLLSVPRAATGGAQSSHDLYQPLDGYPSVAHVGDIPRVEQCGRAKCSPSRQGLGNVPVSRW